MLVLQTATTSQTFKTIDYPIAAKVFRESEAPAVLWFSVVDVSVVGIREVLPCLKVALLSKWFFLKKKYQYYEKKKF